MPAALAENPTPPREEALEFVAGNLCWCTGYQGIVAAVLRAAELTAQQTAEQTAEQTAGQSTAGGAGEPG